MQGIITNIAMPKNILFYLSFLPQFASASDNLYQCPFCFRGYLATIVLLLYMFVTYFSTLATKTLKDNKKFNSK
ncbi:hypothetical protein [Bacillus sp. LR_5]|uniref:hypothetical protein n=1 Tax=Bacillus sp. LR_5 TaxID=3055784 RepID=UPI00366DE9AB